MQRHLKLKKTYSLVRQFWLKLIVELVPLHDTIQSLETVGEVMKIQDAISLINGN